MEEKNPAFLVKTWCLKKLTNEKVSIVLITEEVDRAEILTVEASKSVVIDTAWIKTAVKEKWFEAITIKDTLLRTSHYIRANHDQKNVTKR